MSVDTNNTELKKGADLATIADQRDDQRQQAEAEAAQEVLQRMQDTAAEDEKRRAHEEAEAKRKNSVKKPKLNRPPGKTPWLWVMMKS